MTLNNWEMIAETRSYIFRRRSRGRRRHVCLNSLISIWNDQFPVENRQYTTLRLYFCSKFLISPFQFNFRQWIFIVDLKRVKIVAYLRNNASLYFGETFSLLSLSLLCILPEKFPDGKGLTGEHANPKKSLLKTPIALNQLLSLNTSQCQYLKRLDKASPWIERLGQNSELWKFDLFLVCNQNSFWVWYVKQFYWEEESCRRVCLPINS